MRQAALLRACAALLAAAILAGCAATSSRLHTSEALDAAIAGNHRPESDRARDAWRHPKQTLLFFGLRPEMTVIEVAPGAGWYTRVIAPVVRERGRYLAALPPLDPANEGSVRAHAAFRELADSAPVLDRAGVVPFSPGRVALGPDGSADLIVTFRNIHNWMARDVATAAFSDMYRALKPGGILGVVEHRGNPAVPQDPRAGTGYVNQGHAIRLIEGVGFRLVATSEINANPRDTKDYPGGVWTLPPTFAAGEKDRERYAAIGESDRFTLKFVKPR
jgi:predicted methyltransferase